MIQPGNYDITIQQGADWEKTFQLFDSNEDAVDLTSATVEAEIWTAEKRAKLADFTVTWVDQSIGKFKLGLTDTITFGLPKSGYYDIKVTDANGFSNYWVRGEAILDTGYTE
jgi:hypothetical protein